MKIIFYRKKSGREPIAEFLDSISEVEHVNKVLQEIELLGKCAYDLREPYVKHLEGPLWELRVRFSTNVYRIIYCMKDGKIVLLHGFRKKTQKTPSREIEIARQRYKELT